MRVYVCIYVGNICLLGSGGLDFEAKRNGSELKRHETRRGIYLPQP